jgi:hypothetical protein
LQDLERQLRYAQQQGFHTLILNLQMIKRQGWSTVALGIPILQQQEPPIQLLFSGVAGLKRMAELAEAFPSASFTNTAAHYLAQRYVRLQRDGTRLIKEPVEGHPNLILAENVRLYGDFLAEVRGGPSHASPARPCAHPSALAVASLLQQEFGFDSRAARDAQDLLAVDEAILDGFLAWLESGQLDQGFQGSFPTCGVPLPLRWPCANCAPHPTLGELLDSGADPLDAFLHLAHLAQQVDEEIQVFVGDAGH